MTGAVDDFNLLVVLNAPSDLQCRPRYQSLLDASQSTLVEVLASYQFAEPYPCGLASCRTPHQAGYLVLTEDEKETNVGGICGKRIFGDDFSIKVNQQGQRARLKHQLDTLQDLREHKSALISRISEALNSAYGVKWTESTLRAFKDAVGPSIFKQLRERAKRNHPVVETTRMATQEERDRYRVANPGAKPLQFVSEKVGELTGLDFLNHDCQRRLTELKDKLHRLDGLDAKSLSAKARKDWVDWAGSIERTFIDCDDSVTSALRFFSKGNFDLLPSLTDDVRTRDELLKIRWSTSEMRVIVKTVK